MDKLIEELIFEEKKECAWRFLKMGRISYKKIAKGVGLSLETIMVLAEEIKKNNV